jgi:hypothetical protein
MKLSRAHRHPPTHPRTHPRNRSFRLGKQQEALPIANASNHLTVIPYHCAAACCIRATFPITGCHADGLSGNKSARRLVAISRQKAETAGQPVEAFLNTVPTAAAAAAAAAGEAAGEAAAATATGFAPGAREARASAQPAPETTME